MIHYHYPVPVAVVDLMLINTRLLEFNVDNLFLFKLEYMSRANKCPIPRFNVDHSHTGGIIIGCN